MCGCFDNCVGVLVICVLVFTVFLHYFFYEYLFLFVISVRTAATEWKLNCSIIIIIIIIIILHELGRLTSSDIDALPTFPGASTISLSSWFVVEGVIRQSVVIHSLKAVDPILFVFGSYILYSRDL